MRGLLNKNKYFWPTLGAISLHLVLFALLFVSFSSTPELPPSRPIVTATLYQLESKNSATTQTAQKIAGEAEKTAAQQHEREQLEQKKRAEQQAAARRKAEQERQAEAKKKAEAKKRAEEQKKAEIAKKRAAEQAKAEAERKKAEEKKRQQALAEQRKKEAEAAAKLAAEKKREAERKAEEERAAAALAELLKKETEYQRNLADQQAQQDVARIDDLIVQLIRSNWIRPATARNGMRVDVLVNMLPDGTIRSATVSKSSGDAAFDNSAVAAVLSVARIREVQSLDRQTYERIYRQRIMSFRPEDLSL